MFDAEGQHESWESDKGAPKEMIFSMASNKDKGDAVEEYDISKNPKSWQCPEVGDGRRLLWISTRIGAPASRLKTKFKNWYRGSKVGMTESFKSIFDLTAD